MTKIAQLPDGTSLEFPDDLPDDEMHRQVRQHMGIQEPPTADEIARQQDVALAGMRNQALGALGEQMAQLNATVARLCADQAKTQQLLAQIVQAIGQFGQAHDQMSGQWVNAAGQLSETVRQAADDIYRALAAPVTQKVTRENGKIVETTLKREIQ